MKKLKYGLFALMFLYVLPLFSQEILKPNQAQLRWQQQERIMFVHFGMATWQGREYDNWTTSLETVNPSLLNTDQWCEVAQSWGAKMVLFVAKHCGGFCWWQTDTSDYGVRQIPWRNGKGDVMKDLSASCKKYGLDLGVYIYPGDEHWGAPIGSGGITKDPSKQEAYNRVFRQQLTEVLTQYGPIAEVWFDGNCKVPISDILEKYASNSVIFQGPKANIRWVGNEDGIAPYPNWYTLNKQDLDTGYATALHSTSEGDVYAPVEVDVPFLKNGGHKWFWAPDTDHLLMTKEQLMNLYYHSVGRGAVLLLNSTPDTTGLIPDSHVAMYRMFGEEIARRFGCPVKRMNGKGKELVMKFKRPVAINHSVLREDIAEGQRVRSYVLEGKVGKDWKVLYKGSSVGTRKIDYFPTVSVQTLRIRILDALAEPILSDWAVYCIDEESLVQLTHKKENQSVVVGSWEADTYSTDEWRTFTFDLTAWMGQVGTYELSFSTLVQDYQSSEPMGLLFQDWQLKMYGHDYPQGVEFVADRNVFRITKSQQTLDEYPAVFSVKVKRKEKRTIGEIRLKRVDYK